MTLASKKIFLPEMLGEMPTPPPVSYAYRLRRSYSGKVTKARPITPSGSEMAAKFELKDHPG
jgi:hypothetical protein